MNKLLILLIFLLIPTASAELRINANLNNDGTFIELAPENCRIVGQVQYEYPDNGPPILTIENIVCGDNIFADGFDGQL